MTVSFTTPGGTDCEVDTSSFDLTFTTSSIPPTHQCFNLEDLLNTTESQQSGSRLEQSPGSSQPYEAINWVVYNSDTFSAEQNYSRVGYLQRNVSSPEEGEDGARLFEVFSGRDCVATNSSDNAIYPWYGWTCQSPEEGSCLTVSYSVASFQVASAWEISSRGDKCWTAAYQGAANNKGAVHGAAIAAALMGFTLFMW